MKIRYEISFFFLLFFLLNEVNYPAYGTTGGNFVEGFLLTILSISVSVYLAALLKIY